MSPEDAPVNSNINRDGTKLAEPEVSSSPAIVEIRSPSDATAFRKALFGIPSPIELAF